MKIIFKILLMVGIFWWLIHQGHLDFALIKNTLKEPSYLIVGFLLLFVQSILLSFRAGSLFQLYSKKINGFKLVNVQLIGQLFSTVAPGGVTSDLLKISYIQSIDRSLSKTRIIAILILDRIVGLSSMLLIAGISSLLIYQNFLGKSQGVKSLIILNAVLFLLSILAFSLIFINEKHQNLLISFVPGERLKGWAKDFFYLSKYKKNFYYGYSYSVAGQLISIISFWVVNIPFFESPIDLKLLMSVTPLGFLATTIPITPGGVGVGHAAFAVLLGLIGHQNGASLFNVFWLMCLMNSLLGVIPFLMFQNKSASKSSLEK